MAWYHWLVSKTTKKKTKYAWSILRYKISRDNYLVSSHRGDERRTVADRGVQRGALHMHGVARPVFFQKERISTCCRLLCELLRVVLSEHKSMFPFIVEVFLTRGCVQRST